MVENKRKPGTHPTVTVIVRNFGNNSYFIWEYFIFMFCKKTQTKEGDELGSTCEGERSTCNKDSAGLTGDRRVAGSGRRTVPYTRLLRHRLALYQFIQKLKRNFLFEMSE